MGFNIAFDADGVLYDTEKFQLSPEVMELVKDEYGKELVDKTGYGIKDVYGVDSQTEIDIWTKLIIKYSLFFPPRPGIKEAIDKLRASGDRIYIVTSKACALENSFRGFAVRKLFEAGLRLHGINYDGIEYCSLDNSAKDKLAACEKLNAKIMVEDKLENVEELSKELKVVCVDTLNNQQKFNDNVIRVDNSNDIYAAIMNFKSHLLGISTIFSTFEIKSREEKETMTLEEKEAYYDRLIDYWRALPINNGDIKKRERMGRILSYLMAIVFNKKFDPIVIGRENILEANNDRIGTIFVSNHLCGKDVAFLFSELRGEYGQWHMLAKSELIDEIYGMLFKLVDSVFVDRKDHKSRHYSNEELAKRVVNGHNVFIFPEGTYNRTKNNLKEFNGVSHVYISQVTQAPIVNVALDYSKKPIMRVDKPYVVSRDISIEQAKIESFNRLSSLVEENKKLAKIL